ncbi:MAG: hypothetical protein FWH26_07740 [Oscillospiraceae bacterium]|nr:hypothetical protein [Oscillospiraceae bacterium]
MKGEAKEKKKLKKEKESSAGQKKGGGRNVAAIAVIALALALISLSGASFFGYREWRGAREAREAGRAIDQRVAALEEAAALEKNRESVVIQMEPHGLAAYMADSGYLYTARFSGLRYESGPEAAAAVKLRVPVTVTIFNNSEQTITVKSAALYPWETIFEEAIRQESLAKQQEKGFFGEVTQGQRDSFSIAPGASHSIEMDARLRGVYGHPAMEAETQRFFMAYFGDSAHALPNAEEDVAVKGKGVINGQVNYLFTQALGFYCDQRSTRFTLSYVIETSRGNTFSSSCIIPF